MPSVAHELRDALETQGDYVVRANANSGWFAIFPKTWAERMTTAHRNGRAGPNLVAYKSKSEIDRDHYVVPYEDLVGLLRDDALTHSKVNGISRWNLTLKNGNLHVSHLTGGVDVNKYHGLRLITEGDEIPSSKIFLPEEISESSAYIEGNVQRILVNRYERDTQARLECVKHYGAICFVCGFDFPHVYGEVMDGFIHVHHLRQLSEIAAQYIVDPIADLRPLCPNCHSVTHRRTPPYTPDEVRAMLRR